MVLMSYMVMLLKRLIDDYDTVLQYRNTSTRRLSPSTLAANKKIKKLYRPPPPPPPRPKIFPESDYFVDHTHLVDPESKLK
jgi:hypothetical protein